MEKTGISNFLIGESLIKSDSIFDKLVELNS
jgi:indole-3-glycerol phosphate synthase